MVDLKTGRVVSQNDWKRTQVRMPYNLYNEIVEHATLNDISLNQAMISLIEDSLTLQNTCSEINAFDINPPYLEEETKDIVYFNDKMRKEIIKRLNNHLKNHPTYNVFSIEDNYSLNENNEQILVGCTVWFRYNKT